MGHNDYQLSNNINSEKSGFVTVFNKTDLRPTITEFIRFEEKKEKYIWAHPDEIMFVKSADHYVKSLINCGRQKKWMIRHCTLKELLVVLPPGNFMRLNKFYLINCNHFLRINKNEKLLYLDDGYSIPVPHRISRYILDILKK